MSIQTWIEMAGLALVAACNYWTPMLTRRDLLFGITIDPKFRDSAEAKAIIARFRVWTLAAFAVAVILEIAMPGPMLFLAWLGIQVAGSGFAYARANAAVIPHRVEPTTVRRAELLARGSAFERTPVLAIGPVVLAVAFGIAFAMAPHGGMVDRWNGIEANVERPLSFSLGFFVSTLLCAVVFRFGARKNPVGGTKMPQFILASLVLVNWAGAVFAGASLIAGALGYHWGRPSLLWFMGVMLAGVAVNWFYRIRMGRIENQSPVALAGAPEGDRTPDRCWLWGMFYHNPNDPALMVQARSGPGYTLNFGRPMAWVIAFFFVAGLSAPWIVKWVG